MEKSDMESDCFLINGNLGLFAVLRKNYEVLGSTF